MIYLHKLLPIVFSPLGLVILILFWAALSRRALPIYLAIAFLLAASLPITSNLLFRTVEQHAVKKYPADMPHADAVVVLGGMLSNVESTRGRVTEWVDPDRFFAGVELMKAPKANTLIFMGGKLPWFPDAPPEGKILAEFAQSMGIPKNQILVTKEVQDTEDEAQAVKAIFATHTTPKIILVTSAYHMPRALLIFKRNGFDVVTYPWILRLRHRKLRPWIFYPTQRLSEIRILHLGS